MTLRDLLNTNTNELDTIYIYYSEDAFDELDPDTETNRVNALSPDELNSVVDSWFMDVNFCLHVLIPYED